MFFIFIRLESKTRGVSKLLSFIEFKVNARETSILSKNDYCNIIILRFLFCIASTSQY
jgi:hypothetical protein